MIQFVPPPSERTYTGTPTLNLTPNLQYNGLKINSFFWPEKYLLSQQILNLYVILNSPKLGRIRIYDLVRIRIWKMIHTTQPHMFKSNTENSFRKASLDDVVAEDIHGEPDSLGQDLPEERLLVLHCRSVQVFL